MTSASAPTSASTRTRVPLRALLALAWPIVLARATQSVIGFADALMVAPLGEEPLAAVTTGALNTFAFVILPMGTVFIVQSFVAQLRGRGELTSIPRYAWYGLALSLLAQLLAFVCIPLVPRALGALSLAPGVHAHMSTYVMIRLLSIAPAVATEALGNWYGGLGDTRPAMVAGVVAMLANFAGNYLLIEPHWGLPGYGVAGAAWASVASTWLGFLLIALLFAKRAGESTRTTLRSLRASEFVRMLRFGLPNGVNWFLEFSAFLLFLNLVVAHLGTSVLAAFNVVIQINSIAFMPAFGLASAGAILVGEAIGRRAYQDVWPVVRSTVKVGSTWMISIALIYLASSSALLAWFQPPHVAHSSLLEVGARMLMFSAVWQLFDAVGLTLAEALRAAGDTAWCMRARLVLAWFVFMPLGWASVVRFEGGADAVMISFAGYIVLIALLLALRFRSGKWREIDMVGGELV